MTAARAARPANSSPDATERHGTGDGRTDSSPLLSSSLLLSSPLLSSPLLSSPPLFSPLLGCGRRPRAGQQHCRDPVTLPTLDFACLRTAGGHTLPPMSDRAALGLPVCTSCSRLSALASVSPSPYWSASFCFGFCFSVCLCLISPSLCLSQSLPRSQEGPSPVNSAVYAVRGR